MYTNTALKWEVGGNNKVAEIKISHLADRRTARVSGRRKKKVWRRNLREACCWVFYTCYRSGCWKRMECGITFSLHRWVVGGLIDGVGEIPRARKEASLPLMLHQFFISFGKKCQKKHTGDTYRRLSTHILLNFVQTGCEILSHTQTVFVFLRPYVATYSPHSVPLFQSPATLCSVSVCLDGRFTVRSIAMCVLGTSPMGVH